MKLSIERLKEISAADDGFLGRGEGKAMADELIAIHELKGDQVPVVLVDERQGSGGFCLTQHGRRLNLPHGTELFTAPQNPVVTDQMALAFHFATTDGAAADDDVEDIKTGLRAALSASEITNAPVVLNEVLTAVSIGGSRTELIDALTAIKPKFGAPGSRDIDVRAAHVAIDKAIEKLSNL